LRKLNNYFEKNLKQLQDDLNKVVIHDEKYFEKKLLTESFNIMYSAGIDSTYYVDKEPIQSQHDALIEYFLVRTLQIYCYMFNKIKYGKNVNFDMSFLEQTIKYISQNKFDHVPAILLYYNQLMMLKEDDEKFYFTLKELLSVHPTVLGRDGNRNLYLDLVNFCRYKINTEGKNSKFSKENFMLWKSIIEKEYYKMDGVPNFDHVVFTTIVRTGVNEN